MIKDDQMIFRVPEDLKADFQQAAALADRSAAQILREFMRTFIEQARQGNAPDTLKSTASQRGAAIDFGRASVALEGFEVSATAKELQQRFVRGEITIDECVAGIKQAHQGA